MLKPLLENGFESDIFVRTPSPKAKCMLDKAVEFMANTKDLSHGIDHLNNLIKNAHSFFKATGDKFNIDKETFQLALYWHDVWKSQNKPTAGNYLFQQFYEAWDLCSCLKSMPASFVCHQESPMLFLMQLGSIPQSRFVRQKLLKPNFYGTLIPWMFGMYKGSSPYSRT